LQELRSERIDSLPGQIAGKEQDVTVGGFFEAGLKFFSEVA